MKIISYSISLLIILGTLFSCSFPIRIPSANYDFMLKFGKVKVDYNKKKIGILDIKGSLGADASRRINTKLMDDIAKKNEVDFSSELDIVFDHSISPLELRTLDTEKLKYLNSTTDLDLLISSKIEVLSDDLQFLDSPNNRFDENKVKVTMSVYDINNEQLIKEVSCTGRSKEHSNQDESGLRFIKNSSSLARGCIKKITRKYILQ